MSRVQFIILTGLSVVVAISLLLQLYLAHACTVDETHVTMGRAVMQEAQLEYNHLQQIANWTADVAQQRNDEGLRDLLARNNIQLKPNAAPAPAAAGTTPAAPATR